MDTDTFGRTKVTAKDAVELLNDAFCNDPTAMQALMEARVPCNEELAVHPTIQVLADDDGGKCRVGLLGILNGLFGARDDGRGNIEAVYSEDGSTLAGFRLGSSSGTED